MNSGKTDLSSFNNNWYDHGASTLKLIFWQLTCSTHPDLARESGFLVDYDWIPYNPSIVHLTIPLLILLIIEGPS